ncbi:MAG: NmrA family NAD(P)-binding protein, partial [Hellea sp.]|nr:NmrA family NAD(P)-binding protein [Hellea sp.]
MNKGLVTVFGGSGFLGKYVVRALVKEGWRVRVAVRRPHTAQELKVIGNVGQVQLVQANLRFEKSVDAAIVGSDAVINL